MSLLFCHRRLLTLGTLAALLHGASFIFRLEFSPSRCTRGRTREAFGCTTFRRSLSPNFWAPSPSFSLGPVLFAPIFNCVAFRRPRPAWSCASRRGLTFAIMVSALGHISGGHLNPAITIGYWVTRRLSTLDSLAYWAAQLAGATAAAFFLKLIVPEDIANNVFLGTPQNMRDFPKWSGMALEGVATFFSRSSRVRHPRRRNRAPLFAPLLALASA